MTALSSTPPSSTHLPSPEAAKIIANRQHDDLGRDDVGQDPVDGSHDVLLRRRESPNNPKAEKCDQGSPPKGRRRQAPLIRVDLMVLGPHKPGSFS
jgi:hypothetical protein